MRKVAVEKLKSVDRLSEEAPRFADYFRVANEIAAAKKSEAERAELLKELAASEKLDASMLQNWFAKREAIRNQLSDTGYELKDQNVLVDFDGDDLPEGWTTTGLAFVPVGSGLEFAADGSLLRSDTVDVVRLVNSRWGFYGPRLLRSPDHQYFDEGNTERRCSSRD